MTEEAPTRFYLEGDNAYKQGNLVTALRWWLLGVDEGDLDSLNAALEVSRQDDTEGDDPWNQLLMAIKHVQETPVRLMLQAQAYDETAEAVNRVLETDPEAAWSQFNLGPVDDLTVLSLPLALGSEHVTNDGDEDWMRVLDVLEESEIIFSPLGCSVVAGTWAGDFEWSIPILFGIDPPETGQRKLRVFSPLLIGLPDPEMAPNLDPESPLPQADFTLPLRPMQVLFARGCLALAEVGIISWMPMLRFGADLPEMDRPVPRISVGLADWIMGPSAVHRLRFSLPQVSVGYEIDLSLSGPHLKAAIGGAVDSIVSAVAKTAEACKRSPSVFCEYITSIAHPFAKEQWDDLFAEMVYPPELSSVAIWADIGLASAMVDLGAALARTPGFELDSYQWFDRAAAQGYSPGLASATAALLSAGSFEEAIALWEHRREQCHAANEEASDNDRGMLEYSLLSAESNAAIAAYLLTGSHASKATWRALARRGHVESLLHEHIAELSSQGLVTESDLMRAAHSIAPNQPSGERVGHAYLSLAEGVIHAQGPYAEWCRRGLGICKALGTSLQLSDDQSANRARDLGRHLRESGESELGRPLQEAAARYGLPYAGADHSWGLLSEGRFVEAIALYDETAPVMESLVSEVSRENPDFAATWQLEWANYRSNIALCRIALGEDPAWSLNVWISGASTGHVESTFYPAVVALRAGDTERAQAIVDSMDGAQVAEMTSIALEGSTSSCAFWREWSLDGLRLLQAGDVQDATPSLSSLKSTPTGLGGPRLSDPDPLATASPIAAETSTAFRFCPQCGTARVPDGRFCASCGFAYG